MCPFSGGNSSLPISLIEINPYQILNKLSVILISRQGGKEIELIALREKKWLKKILNTERLIFIIGFIYFFFSL